MCTTNRTIFFSHDKRNYKTILVELRQGLSLSEIENKQINLNDCIGTSTALEPNNLNHQLPADKKFEYQGA